MVEAIPRSSYTLIGAWGEFLLCLRILTTKKCESF
jgi:hypothetical protein